MGFATFFKYFRRHLHKKRGPDSILFLTEGQTIFPMARTQKQCLCLNRDASTDFLTDFRLLIEKFVP